MGRRLAPDRSTDLDPICGPGYATVAVATPEGNVERRAAQPTHERLAHRAGNMPIALGVFATIRSRYGRRARQEERMSPIPVAVVGGLKFRSVTAGDGHTCGTLLDGRVHCWGSGELGAVGNSFPDDQLTPVPVSLGQTFVSVVAGVGFVCGITVGAEGQSYCWGDNFD